MIQLIIYIKYYSILILYKVTPVLSDVNWPFFLAINQSTSSNTLPTWDNTKS